MKIVFTILAAIALLVLSFVASVNWQDRSEAQRGSTSQPEIVQPGGEFVRINDARQRKTEARQHMIAVENSKFNAARDYLAGFEIIEVYSSNEYQFPRKVDHDMERELAFSDRPELIASVTIYP